LCDWLKKESLKEQNVLAEKGFAKFERSKMRIFRKIVSASPEI